MHLVLDKTRRKGYLEDEKKGSEHGRGVGFFRCMAHYLQAD